MAFVALVWGCEGRSPQPTTAAEAAAPVAARAPAEAAAPAGAVDVCVGSEHSCALDAAGAVRCWGDNLGHQVSPADMAQTSAPTLADLPAARRLVCGHATTCVVTRAGEVWCRGAAVGSTAGLAAVRVGYDAGVRDFVLTSSGGCAVGEDGKVRCHASFGAFRAYEVPGVAEATGFEAGETEGGRVCAARRSGSPVCFRVARNMAPKARADAPDPPSAPISFAEIGEVAGPTAAAAAAAAPDGTPLRVARTSATHGCGIDERGEVRCWGRATAGQLGDRVAYLHGPARVPGLDDAVSLSVGEGGACAARRSGEVVCWGRLTDADPPLEPRRVGAPRTAVEVVMDPSPLDAARVCLRAAEGAWSCLFGSEAVDVDARFVGRPKPALVDAKGYTWQLNPRGAPTRDFFFSQIATPVAALSRDGYCAVDTRGRIVCGHCGACDRPRDARTTIAADEPFVAVGSLVHDETAETSVCGLTGSGATRCYAIAAAPFLRAEPAPLAVEGLPEDGAELSAAGGRYEPNLTCVRTRAGAVRCFGDHRHAQHAGSARSARPVEGLPAVVEVGAGGSFACAREAAGAVWCWGSNRDGAAPDGAPLARPQGVRVALVGSS